MSDSLDLFRSRSKAGISRPTVDLEVVKEPGTDEQCCSCYGFLRGLGDRSLSIEFRLANGNCRAFPYSWLGPIIYNPSAGLLLQFVGDMVYHVLIEGSNLNAAVNDAVSLFDKGILRHRITWVREMTRAEAGKARSGEVVIDRIRIASHESNDEPKRISWLEAFKVTGEE